MDRILNHNDHSGITGFDVIVHIHTVFQEFDDGYKNCRITIPNKSMVNIALFECFYG